MRNITQECYRSTFRFISEGIEGLLLALPTLLLWPVLRPVLNNWGARSEDRARSWPGDRFVPGPATAYVRGIDIQASTDKVFPWLKQFGFQRAGFYSYELLERIVGIPVKNVECVVKDLQELNVGDEILLHPKAPGIPVVKIAEGNFICFGYDVELTPNSEKPNPIRSWSMYVETQVGGHSRLYLRGCIAKQEGASLSDRAGAVLLAPIDFLMEQRMLRSIRRLAESM